MRVPSTLTLPPSGSSSPARQASSVDLPEPDGPVTATSSPRSQRQRDALQGERLVVAGVEEAVQVVRLQHRGSSA